MRLDRLSPNFADQGKPKAKDSKGTGTTCNQRYGWYGIKGACQRRSRNNGQAEAAKDAIKRSRERFAEKTRKQKGLLSKPEVRRDKVLREREEAKAFFEKRGWQPTSRVERLAKKEEQRAIAQPFIERAQVKRAGGDPRTIDVPASNPYSKESRDDRLKKAEEALGKSREKRGQEPKPKKKPGRQPLPSLKEKMEKYRGKPQDPKRTVRRGSIANPSIE